MTGLGTKVMEVVPVQRVVSEILGRCASDLEKPRKSPWRVSDPKSIRKGLNEKPSGGGGRSKQFPGKGLPSSGIAAGVPPI